MKETLRKRIVRKIISPEMALRVGVVTMIGTVPYSVTAEISADKKAEQAFPHITSPEQVKQAQQEVLVFDSTVHNLISSGESVVDVTKFTDPSKIRHAIRTIDENNEILKQRRELRQNFQKSIKKRANTIAGGGFSLTIAGIGWMILRASRGKRNNILSPGPSASV